MDFDRIRFDAAQAAIELASFKTWITARSYFSEMEVFKEIAGRRQMACLLGYTILMQETRAGSRSEDGRPPHRQLYL